MKPLIRSAVIMECVANIKYTGISSAPSVCCIIMGRIRKASWSKGKTRKLSTNRGGLGHQFLTGKLAVRGPTFVEVQIIFVN